MVEYAAVVFGLLCVGLTVRQSIWCWPTGLVMVSLYIVIFFRAQLYSDMLLQGVYVVLQIYGWQLWLRGGEQPDQQLAVTRLTPKALAAWCAVAVVSAAVLGTVMMQRTDASFPYLDAFTTTTSLVAQWLMGKKKVASWGFWIVVDMVAIHVYYQKGLYPTAALYGVFLTMAIAGGLAWYRDHQRLQAA